MNVMTMISLTEADREFILGRLDRGHINEIAREVRAALNRGETIEATYCPGDGTYYALLFTEGPSSTVSGSGGGGCSPRRYHAPPGYYVAWLQGDQVFYCPDGVSADWAASRLSTTPGSQLAIAELLAAIR
jgi:hypothetical protein